MLSVVSSSGNQRQGAACAAMHCMSRCVRRAYLCGVDATSGQDFRHRRQWVVDRLKAAADAFAIAVYGYAVMENHFHVVLQTKVSRAREWTDREVVDRWLRLYPHTYQNKATHKYVRPFGRYEALHAV